MFIGKGTLEAIIKEEDNDWIILEVINDHRSNIGIPSVKNDIFINLAKDEIRQMIIDSGNYLTNKDLEDDFNELFIHKDSVLSVTDDKIYFKDKHYEIENPYCNAAIFVDKYDLPFELIQTES